MPDNVRNRLSSSTLASLWEKKSEEHKQTTPQMFSAQKAENK